jgi:crotonobetainyl-CoA:carnitine CoA-transferase CaiB-like acyl-CoA transferase
MEQRAYPLEGMTVLDMGHIYNGPYAGFMLAMAGANVIKIEPLKGEHLRHRGKEKNHSVPFALLNSNKRCVTLNLKAPRGREIYLEMVKKADVVLENFAPDAMDNMKLGWDVLSAANPRLVYGCSSGYGRSGPRRDDLAMDLTVQASSGVMSVTGFEDSPPLKAGAAVCDFSGGVHLYAAIVTALVERERTGKGRMVEVSMQEAIFASLASNLGMYYSMGQKEPPRTGNQHGGLSISPYNVYATRDGYAAINCTNDGHFHNLLRAMGREEIKDDPRYETNHDRALILDEVNELVSGWTKTLDKDDLLDISREHGFPCAPVRGLDEVVNDEHLHQRGMLKWMDHPELGRIALQNSPLRFHDSPLMPIEPSADLGAHNREVYGEWLGIAADELNAMERDGVI